MWYDAFWYCTGNDKSSLILCPHCLFSSILLQVFSKNKLNKIDPEGEKFDPNFHEALFEVPMEGKEPGTVAVVTKIGYKLHDRTIRPALVGVTKAQWYFNSVFASNVVKQDQLINVTQHIKMNQLSRKLYFELLGRKVKISQNMVQRLTLDFTYFGIFNTYFVDSLRIWCKNGIFM